MRAGYQRVTGAHARSRPAEVGPGRDAL